MENIKTATLDSTQKIQIEEWLRQADKHIRGGRYLAADEILQKIFTINPSNVVAQSYQDRIQFLIRQLSQRVGLEEDLCKEIGKYRELMLKRKANQINLLLGSAQKMLDEGNFKKASEQANKALAIDSENIYAKALLQRLTELQNKPGCTIADTEREFKFCFILKESWQNGKSSDDQIEMLKKIQQELNINDGKRLELERDIKNGLYKDALQAIWQTGGLSAFTAETIDNLRNKFDVSRIDHSLIESSLLKEVRKNKIKGNILVVDSDDSMLMEISSKLRSNFFAVISAGTLDEALASLKIVTPDIIISELNYQTGSTGFDLFEFIRTKRSAKHIPFIFTTTLLDRTTFLIGKRLGVEEFFQKPIDYDLFIATLNGKIRQSYNPSLNIRSSEGILAQSFYR